MPTADRHHLAAVSLAAADRVRLAALAARTAPVGPPGGAVVLAGAGIGALAAEAVAAVVQPDAARPVVPVAHGPLPPWVGDHDLVLCVGDTAVAARSVAVGATTVVVGPVAPAGAFPVVVPADPDDRFAFGPYVAAGLEVLGSAGVVPTAREQVDDAVAQLRRRATQLEPYPSPIDRLARRIGRRLPLVVGADLAGIAARAWVAQAARSAKVTGVAQQFPAAAHDAVAGWGQHGDVTRQVHVAVLLRHAGETAVDASRLDRYHVLLEEVVADVHRVDAEGAGPLAALLDLVLQGEQLGVALAVQEGLDPTPEPAVDEYRAG